MVVGVLSVEVGLVLSVSVAYGLTTGVILWRVKSLLKKLEKAVLIA